MTELWRLRCRCFALLTVWLKQAGRNLSTFTTWTMPYFKVERPHRILFRYLELLVNGDIRRLMIFMPPRHGKSELVSRRLPAYFLGRFPDSNVIACSYADDLAGRMNRDCQRIIDSPPYQDLFPGVNLTGPGVRGQRSIRRDDLFEIVGKQGSYRSAGVGGGITGMGFDLGIIDDPFKNFEEAHSQRIRDKVDEWYTTTFWTRQAPRARILLTMTRWHHDDLAGRLLERMAKDSDADQWEVLRLPAIADKNLHPDDDRAEGEALWPERYSEAFMTSARAQGAYFFAGMYQQVPMLEGGNYFKEHWFEHRYLDGATHWLLETRQFSKSDCGVFVTCDPAASEKQSADHTAIGVWAVSPQNDLLLLDVVRGRFGVDGIVPELLNACRRWEPGWVAVEANGFQVAIVKEARKTLGIAPVRELSHEGKGKLVRATQAIVLASTGKLWLPASAPWIKDFIDEHVKFTGLNDRADDQVDMTAYAAWQMPHALFEDASKRDDSEMRPLFESNAANSGLWGR
jgi:predicted phage terminase large subunit-like protein